MLKPRRSLKPPVPLTGLEMGALKYVENTGHTATIAGFDEDHEPVGPMLREKLVPAYLSEHKDGRLRLTEEGMELVLGGPR